MSRNDGGGFHFSRTTDGWEIGRFRILDEVGSVVHAITTKPDPDPAVIARAPDQIGFAKAMNLRQVAYCRQVHGKDILEVTDGGDAGAGDGLVTNVSGLGLMMRSADCPLILAVDPEAGTVGIAHASWRGTVERIAAELVLKLVDRFGVQARNLVACVCPSAGPCCYEVGQGVRAAARRGIGPDADQFFLARGDKLYFDLWSANQDELVRAGVTAENIYLSGLCTICNNDRFPSYRSEGDKAGRFAAVIAWTQGSE